MAAQSITSIQPESGTADTQVRIYGTGFDATASNNTVTFGGTEATLDSAKTNVLYAKVPSGVSGPVEIEVATGGTTVTSARQFSAVTGGDATFSDVGANLQGVGQGANAIADINGDGRLDLVAGETLYYQQSNGSFEAAGVTLERGQDVSIADVNGDGLLDILVAGVLPGGGTVLYEQQSDGSFAEAGAGIGGGRSASIADVNGDGALDILVAANLYLQQSDGSFDLADANLTSVGSAANAIGDVNGDGLLDLLITGQDLDNNDVTTLYLQQSDGTFQAAQAGLEGVAGGSASMEDIDGDGNQDLLITGYGSGARRSILYLQQSDGSFGLANAGLTEVSSSASAIADFNNDGRSDLALAGSDGANSQITEIYLQQSDGSFTPANAGLTGVSEGDLSTADVGGDGGIDLLINGVIEESRFDSEVVTTLYGSSDELAPAAPTNLTAQPGDQQVELFWDPNSDSDLAGYNLYRSPSSFSDTASATRVNSGLIDTTNYVDAGLSNGTNYYYRLVAVDDVGNQGGTSEEASGTPSKSAALRITGVEPSSGVPGTAIRVYGKGFSTTASDNTVTFGGTTAPIDSAKSNVLYTRVPSGATGGAVEVSMSLEGGTATASKRFSVVTDGGTFLGDLGANLTGVDHNSSNGASSIADVNGDGALDLLVTGVVDNASDDYETTLYLQQSDGSFEPANAGLTDVTNASTSIADVNDDGALDLLIAGLDENFDETTTLYLQQEDGSFEEAGAGLLGLGSSSMSVADVNGDGALDLLLTGTDRDFNAHTILYLQQPDGSFVQAEAGLGDVAGGGDTAIDDVNGDGTPDLLVTGSSSATLYLQQDDGSFESAGAGLIDVDGGTTASIADVDGDGDQDLLITGGYGFQSARTDLYLQQSDGSFDTADANLDGQQNAGAAIADVDGNGRLDLILLDAGLYLQQADGSFEPGFGLPNVYYGSVSVADVTNDGALDLLVTGDDEATLYGTNHIALAATPTDDPSVDLTWDTVEGETLVGYELYRSTSPITGSPSEMDSLAALDASTTSYVDRDVDPGQTYYYRMTVVDTAGTESDFTEEVSASPNEPPLVVSSLGTKSGAAGTPVRVYGNGFSPNASDNTVTFGGVEAIVDSAKQTVIYTRVPTGTEGGPTSVSVSTGEETVTSAQTFSVVTEGGTTFGDIRAGLETVSPSASAIDDINGDGMLDLLISGSREDSTPATILYLQQSDGTFEAANAGLTDVTSSSVSIGDVNDDGALDLLVAGEDAPNEGGIEATTALYLQQSDGSFETANAGLADVEGANTEIIDINGDGELDLIVQGLGADGEVMTLYLQQEANGGVSFEEVNPSLSGVESIYSLSVADVNGDAAPDLLVTGSQGFEDVTALYLQQGDGSFEAAEAGLTGVGVGESSIADVNGDGTLDLLIGGYDADGNQLVTLYMQQSDGSFEAAEAGLTGRGGEIGDVTGDGRPDLFITGFENDESIQELYVQQDDGSFQGSRTNFPAVSAIADFTGDGALDLLVGDAIYANGVESSIAVPPGLSATGTDAPAVELSWDAVDSNALARYRLYRSEAPITGSPSGLTPFDSTEAGTTNFTDEPTPGDTYYYRVTAVDTAGTESGFSNGASAFVYPSEVSASASRTFGGATDSTGYRLVALPGQADRPVADAVSGEAGSQWQAYYDDGSEEGYLVEHDGSDTFRFQKGNGFWLTATSEWTFDQAISTIELRGDSAATIGLRDGWNVISNPTGKDVAWSRVNAATPDTLQAIFGFDGAFAASDTFRTAASGVAYYFFNDNSSRDSLVIPYPGAPGNKAAPKADGSEEAPMLALTAAPAGTDDAPSSTVRLGISEAASRGVDGGDLIAPPGRFANTSLRIKAPKGASGSEQSSRAQYLMTERRPPVEGTAEKSDGHTFRLRLTSQAEGPVTLIAENLDAIEGRSVALLHPTEGTTYDLREEQAVTIEPSGEPVALKVAVGSEAYVEGQKSDVVPAKVRLTSYPNPVGQQGTVEYALPEETDVTLRVYDVLGREVATLAKGRKAAGRHTVQLSTDGLSSGVYFGRLQAGGQTRTLKITVVR